jgi:hypothetical protein
MELALAWLKSMIVVEDRNVQSLIASFTALRPSFHKALGIRPARLEQELWNSIRDNEGRSIRRKAGAMSLLSSPTTVSRDGTIC